MQTYREPSLWFVEQGEWLANGWQSGVSGSLALVIVTLETSVPVIPDQVLCGFARTVDPLTTSLFYANLLNLDQELTSSCNTRRELTNCGWVDTAERLDTIASTPKLAPRR